MWHESDLQNSRGGAINHIGSGINHCVEDIFCHRCPLTITLRKNPSALPPRVHPTFFPSVTSSATKATTDWSQEEKDERCPFQYLFKMQVKVYRLALRARHLKYSSGVSAKEPMKLLFLKINLIDDILLHCLYPTALPL